MSYTHILGIDISKNNFDVALSHNKTQANHINRSFPNTAKGYTQLQHWLKKEHVAINQVLVCLEDTGLYHRALVAFLQQNGTAVWVENPCQIKWSMGLQRGKSDPVDAQRIGLYAFRNQDKAKLYLANDKKGKKLADLLALRERLIQTRSRLLVPVKELRDTGLEEEACLVEKACHTTLKALHEDISNLEKQLQQLIKSEKALNDQYRYITSVASVGVISALHLIVHTDNFSKFDSAKKLACYAGVAPFPHQSGSSVRGRNQVHHMANKALKKALHMCAMTAIRYPGELKAYFDRKVKEGKNKMAILNAIRNKLILRIFACVRDQRLYSPTCNRATA